MKIEKLSENKIRIIFDYNDLEENNIDFHSFMSNSIQSQTLFLKILDLAEKTLNFKTEEYKLEVNTIALTNGNFILIITRLQPENKPKKKIVVHTRRKSNCLSPTFSIYRFKTFDEFTGFCQFLSQNSSENLLKALENSNSLYKYNLQYFLSISTDKLNISQKEFLFSSITEFADFVNNSQTFLAKLKENTICFLDKNAINLCIK